MTAAGPGPEPQPDLGDHEEPETFLVTGPVAVPWSRGWSGPGSGVPAAASDAELARAACSDPAAFAAVYDRYSDRLHDDRTRMLRDRDAAADAVQDTFTTVATRLPQLREPEKLRPWLYAIARNEAHRRLKARRREQLVDELPDHATDGPGPDTHAARRELAALMDAAALGLPERERSILELHYRHGLDGPELAAALGLSGTNANTVIGRARTMIERSLGALLLARRARSQSGNSCAGLGEVLAAWDGTYSVLWRKRIARHVEHCPTCTATVRDMVNPQALLGATPVLLPAPAWLRHHVLHHAGPPVGSSTASGAGAGAGAGKASWWPTAQRAVTPLRVAVAAPLIAIPAAAGLIWAAHPAATTAVLAQPAVAAPAAVGGQPRFEFDMPTGTYRASTTASTRPGGRPVAPSSSAPALLPRGPAPLTTRPPKRLTPPNPAGPSVSATVAPPESKPPPETPTTPPNRGDG